MPETYERVFDDGSTGRYNADGDLIGLADAQGQPQTIPGPSGSGIIQQFEGLFNQGINAALKAGVQRLGGAPGQPAGALPAPASATAGAPRLAGALQQYLPYIAFVGLAVGIFRLLKR